MAGDTTITVVGNLTADPELRFTPSGAAVANFTVASTPASSTDRAQVERRRGAVPAVQYLARSRGERGRKPYSWFPCHRDRPTQAALLRDPRGREAHRGRGRGRRNRPVAAVRDRQGQQGLAWWRWRRRFRRWWRRGSRSSEPADDPWGSAPASGSTAVDDEPPF